MPEPGSYTSRVQAHFGPHAAAFAQRTEGRFQALGVVEFARARPDDLVVEVGAGTGNFLSLFAKVTDRLVAVDLTVAMLAEAGQRFPGMALVAADGARLPLPSRSVDIVASAQTLHHIPKPVPVLEEMRRVATEEGRVLIVDQVATERFEEAVVMNELEILRDPSHAASRAPSAFRMIVQAAGLRLLDERIVDVRERLSGWMWPGEFSEEHIAAVRAFIERHGAQTGMKFERDGDDWSFTRRRIMLLAAR